jgi:hypothetical protein
MASKDARERACDPAIQLVVKRMDPRVKPVGDGRRF